MQQSGDAAKQERRREEAKRSARCRRTYRWGICCAIFGKVLQSLRNAALLLRNHRVAVQSFGNCYAIAMQSLRYYCHYCRITAQSSTSPNIAKQQSGEGEAEKQRSREAESTENKPTALVILYILLSLHDCRTSTANSVDRVIDFTATYHFSPFLHFFGHTVWCHIRGIIQ
jgi:hypothetical protein